MSRKTIFYIAFFSVLVVGFFVILGMLVPDFGKRKINPIGSVKQFSFTNQDGRTVTENDVLGKVFVTEYFFTTCKSICPRMNRNMKTVYERFKNEPEFLILSHTSDPATDSSARLKTYADSLGVNTSKWIFLTGRKDSLYKMARHSYKIDDPNNHVQNPDDDFLHSQFFAVVNKKGEVIRVIDGLKESEVKDMMGTIEKLLKE